MKEENTRKNINILLTEGFEIYCIQMFNIDSFQ